MLYNTILLLEVCYLHINMFATTTFVCLVKVICKDNTLCNVGLSCYTLEKSDKIQF
jgi:hypothetical protein